MRYQFCKLDDDEKPVIDNLAFSPSQCAARLSKGQPAPTNELSGEPQYDPDDYHMTAIDNPRLDIAEVFEMQEDARDALDNELNNKSKYLI